MKARYVEESGAEFDEAGDIAIRLKVLAGEIYNMQTQTEWLKRQLFPSTASGEFLDRFAQQRGLERREAVKARGSLIFRVNETKPSAIAVPSGSVVSTDGEIPVRVRTTEDCVIAPGSYSATAAAEAEEAGYRGNINVRTAEIPVSVPSGVDSVTNMSTFSGGADRESDTALRSRILDSYICQPNGMNSAYYIALATSVDGVAKAGVIQKLRGAGTLNLYVAAADGTISNDKLVEVQLLVDRERELNVDVLVGGGSGYQYDLAMSVTPKEGYENAEVISICSSAFEDYLASIPMGGRLYLSTLGKYLLDTGCIKTYEFDQSMSDMTIAASLFFTPGDIDIEVL